MLSSGHAHGSIDTHEDSVALLLDVLFSHGDGRQRRTHRHGEEDTETLSARDDADSVVLKTKREMYSESCASCSVFSMCHLFLNSILALLFPFSSTF